MDALALSDRFLCCGASDRLLQLLIEREEENSPVFEFPLVSAQHFVDDSWQYCLRLKDKDLAARLALKCVSMLYPNLSFLIDSAII